MAIDIYNSEMLDGLKGVLQARYEPQFALGNAASTFLMLPKLRALWLHNSISETNVMHDATTQLRALAPGTAPSWGVSGLVPYTRFQRLASQYLTRADENGLDISPNITILTWIKFGVASTGNITGILDKWTTAANNRSYALYKSAGDVITFSISSLGTAVTVVSAVAPAAVYSTANWLFLAGRFTSARNIELFVSGTWYTQATALNVIFNGTAALDMGRFDAANYLEGDLALTALCADAHPDAVVRNAWEQTRAMFGV
jgi:hypothetical protein